MNVERHEPIFTEFTLASLRFVENSDTVFHEILTKGVAADTGLKYRTNGRKDGQTDGRGFYIRSSIFKE
jgi:hypothetical protein